MPKGEYTSIEKIQLTSSKELDFQLVDQNEEKYYGDIRVFVDSYDFTGHTKKGFQLTRAQLKSLKEILENLDDIEHKENSFEVDSIQLSNTTSLIIRFKRDKYTNHKPSIDIRKHIDSNDYTGFTKQGFHFPLDHREKFKKKLKSLIGEIEKKTNVNQESDDDSSKIDEIKEDII